MQQLPDLTPWLTENRADVFDYTVLTDELRLTSAIANVGEGALEVRGGEVNGDVQEVFQRIFSDDGTSEDRLAGEFRYHENHGHIHFEDFAEFRLRSVEADGTPGDIVASGDKVSFCLIDVESYDGSGPRQYLSCGQVQGISAGWADVYDKGLPGQSIDISNIADGQYFLEIAVDPLNQLTEADETNNVSSVLIDIDRGLVNPLNADTFESNDTIADASTLAPPEDHLYENLTIHEAYNDDYYRITASGDGEISFTASFDHGAGDIDMRVYDANLNQIGISQSITDEETFTVNASAGDDFYVRVYGYSGATNENYSLFVDQAAEGHNHGNHDNVVADIPNQTQFLYGDAEHNDVFIIDGSVADYSWGPTEDGEGIVVWGPTGADLLYDYDWIDFNDASIGTEPETGGDGIVDVANVTQFLTGTGDADNFIIDGNSADYNWGPTEDGTGIVVWGPTGADLLTGFETITFNDQAIDLNAPDPVGGVRVNDNPGTTQYEFGTSETDTFVIAGDSSDYAWANTADGGVVVWNQTSLTHDLLYDFEEIEFDDTTVDDFA